MLFTLAFAMLAATPAASGPTRANAEIGYMAVLRSWDRDGDDRLSYAEIDQMVETGLFSPKPLEADQFLSFKETMRSFYKRLDVNADGFVDRDELLNGALATFDCMDLDKDGVISNPESQSAKTRCRTG